MDSSWPSKGEISVQKIDIKYRPEKEIVIHDLSFDIQPGQKLGVCGRSGAGKSTISLCLSRIMELEKGTVFIDGVDISKVDLALLR